MKDLSNDNQADIINAFNSTSQYLDDLLNIDNPYFEGIVNQIYPPELQLNRANIQIPGPPFWIYISLFQTALFQGRRRRYDRSGHGRTTFLTENGFGRTPFSAEYIFLFFAG